VSDPSDRLKDLEDRISRVKGAQEPEETQKVDYSQAELAWRMVLELVVGILVGLGVGYGLDALFGTRPVLMILFIFFGLAAGIRTMLRTAEEVGKTMPGQGDPGPNGDD